MGKKELFALLCVLTLLLTGCRKAEFTVSFELSPSVSGNFNMLYYASDSERGFLTEGVAVVQHGKCEFKGQTVNPTLVFLFGQGAEPAMAFYVERGDHIRIEGDNDNPATWRVSGNKISEEMSEWRMDNRDVLASHNPKNINAAVARYVTANPDRASATLLMQLYYDRGLDSAGFDALARKLKDDAADSRWTELMARNDMTAGYGPMPDKAPRLVLRTAATGCDTLDMTRGTVLFYFADRETEGRQAALGELRRVMKERKDSASLPVVNVCLSPDSMSWNYAIREDSLRGVVNAWMPLGFSDAGAVSLGVGGAPTFVVVRNGRIVYRGENAPEAARHALAR